MTITPGTAAFYDDWAVNGQEAARSAISKHFASAFAPGARVLDVGCGMGRDLAALLEMGFDACGIEPHDAMRARAIERHPNLAGQDPCRRTTRPQAVDSATSRGMTGLE
jgi:SAM-dependent methyltransferase